MNTTRAAAVLAAAALSAGTVSAVSEPVQVDAFSDRDNLHWTTVYTNAVPLRWEWNPNADSAQLAIVGMNKTVVTDFPSATSNWVWTAFDSAVPASEDVYALTLTFYGGGGGAVVGAMTSRLAVVTGAFGQTSVDPSPEKNEAWRKVSENAVIPYDAGWTEATVAAASGQLVIAKDGGLAQTNALPDVSGYYGWKIKGGVWGYGTFDLALSFPGTVTNVWDAALVRLAEGFMFSVK